jgi:hypothetical protein
MASATEESMIMPRVGVITKAGDCRLHEINNKPAADFLREVGFPVDDPHNNRGLLSSIFVLHINDGVNVSRIPHALEGTSLLCGGDLTEGAVLSIAFNTRDVVLQSAQMAMGKMADSQSCGTAIIHSCLGRRYGLLSEPQAEMDLIQKTLGKQFNCIATYANGELCPAIATAERMDNRFHNQTLVACIF